MASRTAAVVDGLWSTEVEDPGADKEEIMGVLADLMPHPTPDAAKARLLCLSGLAKELQDRSGEAFSKEQVRTLVDCVSYMPA